MWNNTIHMMENGAEKAMKMPQLFPQEFVKRVDNAEMYIELATGATYQVMGADADESVDRLRGPNPVGLIWSEYAHGSKMEKAADTLAPVLAENGGWEQYVYTPNGPNHGERLWQSVQKLDFWFKQKLTIDDSRRDALGENGAPVVPLTVLEELRAKGMREEFIQQEFYCSFTGFMLGTIYGSVLQKADRERRIGRFPYIINHPVGMCIDLGHSDAMAVWFYQLVGGAVQFIDYWEDTLKDIKDVARMAKEEKPYIYGGVRLPWDGRSAANYLEEVGFQNVIVGERPGNVNTAIEAVHRDFDTFYFDEVKCAEGIAHLREYSRKYDDDKGIFSEKPSHDRHSHAADALRNGHTPGFGPLYFNPSIGAPVKVEVAFDPRVVTGGIF
jgi:hypothetical protein